MKGEIKMTQPDIQEQSQKCMERDRLKDQRTLQKEQQQFELKNFKKMLTITIISIIVALLSLAFAIFEHYSKATTTAVQESIIDSIDKQ